MPALFAFLHHLAAFALVSALAVELVLLRGDLTLPNAKTLVRVDAIYGLAAVLLLIVGSLRVMYFEKGATYYGHSVPFMTKISLFVLIGLVSIAPTRAFLSWRPALRRGELPVVAPEALRRLRGLVHLELAAVVFVLLCAALMARGIGVLA